MIIYHDELVSINIEGHGIINFNNARLNVSESSGFKSWEIDIEGANDVLTKLLFESNSKYQLKMVGKNGNKYIGEVILVRNNNFLGTGELKMEEG